MCLHKSRALVCVLTCECHLEPLQEWLAHRRASVGNDRSGETLPSLTRREWCFEQEVHVMEGDQDTLSNANEFGSRIQLRVRSEHFSCWITR